MKHIKLFEAFTASQKVNEYLELYGSWDESREGEPTKADEKKWKPVLKAFKVKDMGELVWLSDSLPDSDDFEANHKIVKEFDLKSTRDDQDEWQDPHGRVDFNVIEYKGLLIGDHSDAMRYYGALVRSEDVAAWEEIYKESDTDTY